MSIEVHSRAAQAAGSRLQGAVGQLMSQAAAIRNQRDVEFAGRLAVRRSTFPSETELASITAVETDLATTIVVELGNITYDASLQAELTIVAAKLQAAATAAQSQI